MKTQGLVFAIFLGSLATLPPIATDMALPALGAIGASLKAGTGLVGLTLSVFMAGFAVSPIVYGPLADRFGRRPLLLIGLVLFTLGSFAAAASTSITLLLFSRLLQGLGAGSGLSMAMAMVRDLFTGKVAQARLAIIIVVANLAPIVAPALGAGLVGLIGWRGIYAVMGLSSVMLLGVVTFGLQETAPDLDNVREPLLPGLVQGYKAVLGHGSSMAFMMANGLGFSWMFAYVAGSPLLIIKVLHASPTLYSAMFACTGGGIIAGAALNGRLVHRSIPAAKVLLMAVGLAVTFTFGLVCLSFSHLLSLWTAMPLLVGSTAAFGLAAPSAAHGALDPLPEQAGVAGGLLTSIQMLLGAVASTVVAFLFPALGVLAMTGTMFAAALLAAVFAVPLSRETGGLAAATPSTRQTFVH